MSQLIRTGQGLEIPVPAGQSLRIASISGTYSAAIVAGAGIGALATNSSAGDTYGPYAGGVVIRISCSADGVADYAVGTPATLDYMPVARLSIDPATGDAVSVGSADGNRVRSVAENRAGSQLRAGKPWVRLPSSVTGMLATSANATIAAVTRRGRPAIEVTVAAVTTAQGIHIPLPGGAQLVTAFQHMVIEVEDAAQWNSGNWRLGFFDGTLGTLTNGMQRVLTVGASNGWSGDHLIAPLTTPNYISASGGGTGDTSAVSEWAAVGTGSFAGTNMTQLCVRGARAAGPVAPTRFWIYEIAEAERNSIPQIVFTADDGALDFYLNGLSILERYGFSCGMGFIADERGVGNRMSQAQWADAIINRGHHAVVHGCRQINGVTINSLRDYFGNTYGYASPQAAMEADIAYNRDVMVAEGLDPDGLGRTVYVVPQGNIQPASGAGDNTIANAMRNCGMVGARLARVEGGFVANGGGAGSILYIPIIGHNFAGANEAANRAAIIATMQAEIGAGRHVVVMTHQVLKLPASPASQAQMMDTDLEAIASAAATLVRSGAARAGRLTDLVYEARTYTAPVHIGA